MNNLKELIRSAEKEHAKNTVLLLKETQRELRETKISTLLPHPCKGTCHYYQGVIDTIGLLVGEKPVE